MPFSPVHSARKFSAVRGTTSLSSRIKMRPAYLLLIVMSKKTRGKSARLEADEMGWDADCADMAAAVASKEMLLKSTRSIADAKQSRLYGMIDGLEKMLEHEDIAVGANQLGVSKMLFTTVGKMLSTKYAGEAQSPRAGRARPASAYTGNVARSRWLGDPWRI